MQYSVVNLSYTQQVTQLFQQTPTHYFSILKFMRKKSMLDNFINFLKVDLDCASFSHNTSLLDAFAIVQDHLSKLQDLFTPNNSLLMAIIKFSSARKLYRVIVLPSYPPSGKFCTVSLQALHLFVVSKFFAHLDLGAMECDVSFVSRVNRCCV